MLSSLWVSCLLMFLCQMAVAIFEMVEYYESACKLNISFNKGIGPRGWMSCSRLVRKVQLFFHASFNSAILIEYVVLNDLIYYHACLRYLIHFGSLMYYIENILLCIRVYYGLLTKIMDLVAFEIGYFDQYSDNK